ncbi:hypothetical protein [Brevibacterium litoralis]|uniref:hypothetical protein n=1 Tax=Brevibacterium litoralis TaxID=3138935 RepID=UPI0032EEBDA3
MNQPNRPDRPAVPPRTGGPTDQDGQDGEATQVFDAAALDTGTDREPTGEDVDATAAMSIEDLENIGREDSARGSSSTDTASEADSSADDAAPATRPMTRREAREAAAAGATGASAADTSEPSTQSPARGQDLAGAVFAASAAQDAGAPQGSGPRGSAPQGSAPAAAPATGTYTAAVPLAAVQQQHRGIPGWAWAIVLLCCAVVIGVLVYIVTDVMTREDPFDPSTVEVPPAVGEEEPGEIGGPTEEAPAEDEEEVDVESFASPSGNISCTISPERARCSIADYDYEASGAPDDCAVDYGSVVVANADGAGYSCSEIPEGTPAATALPYGEEISAHGMTCLSEETGMTCTSDETDRGFTLARAGADFVN